MLLLLAIVSAPAAASTVQDVPDTEDDEFTGVGMTPARVEVDLDQRSAQLEIVVFNDANGPRTVSIEAAALGHTLDGAPEFGPRPATVSVDGGGTVTLAQGEVRRVGLAIAFPNQVAEYVSLIATIAPVDDGRTVTTQTRVASLLLLRGPRPWDQTVEARDVGLEYADGAVEASLFVDVANVGNAHVRPTGRFVVRQDGDQIAVVELPGENILPGFARRLRAAWVPDPDLSGPIDIDLELEDGSSATGSADLEDIARRVGEERRDQGLPAGGATLSVDGEVPAPLSLLAVFLLLTALATLFIVWRRERDDEDEERPGDDPRRR